MTDSIAVMEHAPYLPPPEAFGAMLTFQDVDSIDVDGKFHVRDIALSRKLGFTNGLNITIHGNRVGLKRYGLLRQRGASIANPQRDGSDQAGSDQVENLVDLHMSRRIAYSAAVFSLSASAKG